MLACFNHLNLYFLYHWANFYCYTVNSQTATASPLIILSSPLSEGQRVCPRDQITFTCVTNGSASHAWSSDEYIGQGGAQLELASYHDPGRMARNWASPIGTQAILVSKEIEENEIQGILESQLNIVVTSDYQITTINCLHVDTGSQETTRFQLLGMLAFCHEQLWSDWWKKPFHTFLACG